MRWKYIHRAVREFGEIVTHSEVIGPRLLMIRHPRYVSS
jgi:hypothetical protein